MPDPQGTSFKLCWSEKNRARVRALGKKAVQNGIRDEFLEALKHILGKLATEPLSWGDPNYRLHAAGLVVCHGIYSILQVYYGVDTQRRLIYIKDIEPLPGHVLGQGD